MGIGAPVIALGLTEGVSNFAQAWSALWGGRINDRREGRYPSLIAGYILTGLKALEALVFWWPRVILIRTVAWIGRGARGPIRDAYIAEEVPPQHWGKAYGLRETFDTAGALLGPLTAAVLGSLSPDVPGLWVILFAATGFARAIIAVGQKMVTVRIVPGPVRGRGLGQIAAATGAGQLVAGVVMGGLWSISQAREAFFVEAALVFAGLVVMVWALGRERGELAGGGD